MQTGPSRTRVSISASVVTCRVPALSHSTPSRSEAASLSSRLSSNRNLQLANVHLCRPLRASDPRQERTSPTSKCITCARRASQTQKKSRSARAQAGSSDRSDSSDLYEQPDEKVKSASAELVVAGEDAANFQIQEQSATSWSVFSVLLIGALSALYAAWISPDSGFANNYVRLTESWSANPEVVVVSQLAIFALFHSGLAYLRPVGEKLIGARAWRVLFAFVSLPLALVPIVFFINHRYSGVPLWNIRGQPFVHEAVWCTSLLSFLFLYPSTFNLLEVAAVDKPKLHLWDTGVTRITRHPQAFGQLLWCIAHTAWIGNSFMVTTSIALMVHHAFGCWHGDLRLRREWGDDFEEVKGRTSIVPFQALWEGRQKLPTDYWKEWFRPSYASIIVFSVAVYYAHPLMQRASYWLSW